MAESIIRKNIDLDILDYYDGKIKDYVDDKVGTGGLTVDDTLSDTSENPVQNKVIKQAISTKVDKISGKNLSTNDLTDTLKNNYDAAYTHSQSAHAPSSAQANVIETIKVNNTALTPTNKTVNITVPSNTDCYVNKAVFVDDSTSTVGSPIKMTLTRAGSDTNTITANIPKVSSSSAGVVPKGSAVSSQSKTTKFLREDGTWATPSYTTNTDTKVTAVGNHYTPTKSTTKSASGGTLTDITNSTSGTQVVTGVEMDAKGHVTGITSVALKSTDTKVTVDSALSSTSTNPVQNKTVNSALAGKADIVHTHYMADISDLPEISNPNLLINPDFRINQRGISGVFSDTLKYFVDRWRLVSGTVTVNTDGTITLNGSICQPLENAVGTNVTASVSAGTAAYDTVSNTFTITGDGVTLLWAKLEHGNVATPFVAPDPATELMKCCRYFQVVDSGTPIFGIVANSNTIRLIMPVICPMRKKPTLQMLQHTGNFTWSFIIKNIAGTSLFVTTDFSAIYANLLRTDGANINVLIDINDESLTLSTGEIVYASGSGGVYFELDAEI